MPRNITLFAIATIVAAIGVSAIAGAMALTSARSESRAGRVEPAPSNIPGRPGDYQHMRRILLK